MKRIISRLKKLHWKIKNIQENKQEEVSQVSKKKKTKPTTEDILHISATSVAKATLVVIGLLILKDIFYEIRQILLIFFISFLFAAALDPFVDKLQKKHIPRWFSVISIYLIILIILAILISNIVPLIAAQTQELANSISDLLPQLTSENAHPAVNKVKEYINQFLQTEDITTLTNEIQSTLKLTADTLLSIAGNTWEAIKIVSNGLINTGFVLVLTFFMVVEEKNIENFFLSLFPSRHGNYITDRITAVKTKIGHWLRGQLLLSITIGVLTFIGLTLLGINYAATLASIAAITELVPYVGPILAWIFALPIAANQSLWLAFAVSILYFVVQELENNFLVPIIMQKTVGLNPIIVLFAMLVGAHYLGVLGLIIAIPVATCTSIFVRDYTSRIK